MGPGTSCLDAAWEAALNGVFLPRPVHEWLVVMHYVHKLCKEEPKMRFLVIFSSTLVDRIDYFTLQINNSNKYDLTQRYRHADFDERRRREQRAESSDCIRYPGIFLTLSYRIFYDLFIFIFPLLSFHAPAASWKKMIPSGFPAGTLFHVYIYGNKIICLTHFYTHTVKRMILFPRS